MKFAPVQPKVLMHRTGGALYPYNGPLRQHMLLIVVLMDCELVQDLCPAWTRTVMSKLAGNCGIDLAHMTVRVRVIPPVSLGAGSETANKHTQQATATYDGTV